MKKIFALLLSLVLIFSLCACGAKEEAPAAAPAAPAAPAEEEGCAGCGGFSIAATFLALVCGAGAAIVIKKK